MKILDKRYYYFIGAGGIGMSALERYFKSLGKEVLGYDRTETDLTIDLTSEGIMIRFEDDIALIPTELEPNNTLVIYTPAVQKTLNIYQYFQNNGFEIIKRSEVLGEITKKTYSIAVAGTHGKTTTSTILGHILKTANLESTAFLGGIAQNYNSNVILNGNKITVAEADEFDRSFLKLFPKLAIITSNDADHLDIYGEREAVKASFVDFANQVEEQLFVKKGLPFPQAKTYGIDEDADYNATNVHVENGYYTFDVQMPNTTLENVTFPLPGRYNVENAVAASAIANYLKIPNDIIISALAGFEGIKRRFNRFIIGDKIYIDDYAHHPTELNAVISSIKELYPDKKLLGVFQPHLYTRTRDFAEEFATSLSLLDSLLLLDIYPAREEAIDGVTSNWLAEKVQILEKEVCSLEQTLDKIKDKNFDILLTVGAGNIDKLVKPIKKWLNEKQ